MKIKYFLLLLTLCIVIACKSKTIVRKTKIDKLTIYSADIGKDEIQAKSKALSFLSDQKSGYTFKIYDSNIELDIIENRVNFIIASKMYTKKIENKVLYVCKMDLKDIFIYNFIKKYYSVKIDVNLVFGEKKIFFKNIIETFFKNVKNKKTGYYGKIYLVNFPQEQMMNENTKNVKLKFMFLYRKLKWYERGV